MTSKDIKKEFFELFEKEYATGGTRLDAYERCESQFMHRYNHRMYANFHSFNILYYRRKHFELQKVNIRK